MEQPRFEHRSFGRQFADDGVKGGTESEGLLEVVRGHADGQKLDPALARSSSARTSRPHPAQPLDHG
jgi:hypothetical protein